MSIGNIEIGWKQKTYIFKQRNGIRKKCSLETIVWDRQHQFQTTVSKPRSMFPISVHCFKCFFVSNLPCIFTIYFPNYILLRFPRL